MAIKIIENENGTVTEKTSRQITRERKLHKFQKAAGVTAMTAAMLAASSLSVFAANSENSAPSNVNGGYACCFFSVRFCCKRRKFCTVQCQHLYYEYDDQHHYVDRAYRYPCYRRYSRID